MIEKEKQARKLREERLEWREKGTKRDKERSRRGARRESNNGEKMYGQHVVINKRSSSA